MYWLYRFWLCGFFNVYYWLHYRKWKLISSTTSFCQSSAETVTMESSLQNHEHERWQRLTESMWMVVQYSSKLASMWQNLIGLDSTQSLVISGGKKICMFIKSRCGPLSAITDTLLFFVFLSLQMFLNEGL